ncbi:hypothetical protein NUU61_001082 [Penicillium alfredii]|uniref:SCP domain-containing protein n=1 Tax=Penicillium alfredii TaxID=1506179 RepID=A0A9W9GBB2_9EURO|nr:uncharacterized protein NUU61_001082 [Penicillium alfredii]KAJ5115323.1 hypothetical protein NUU61_001082 [Penicillium alfredii]
MVPKYFTRTAGLLFFTTTTTFFVGSSAQEVVVVTVEQTADAATTSTVWATPTIPSPASYTSLDDFKDTVLQVSNDYRNAHDASPLVWNETLVEYSRDWAEACIWKHSNGPYGENLAYGYSNASAAVAAWGDERTQYDFGKPTGFTEATGHFTQLVWRSTTEMGCAAVNCGYTEDQNSHHVRRSPDGKSRAQGWYVVCEYTPAGNVVGRHDKFFKLNVKARTVSETSAASTPSIASTGSGVQPTGGARVRVGVDSTVGVMLLALGTVGVGMGLYT